VNDVSVQQSAAEALLGNDENTLPIDAGHVRSDLMATLALALQIMYSLVATD